MSLRENKDKTPEERARETALAEKLLGIELESFDAIYTDPMVQPIPSPDENEDGEKEHPTK
ncbi:MAG: hypothetical protein A3J55_03950 [Candidatus Ryanbacteria bacterium RIFCSPHIGHO2_02_FULL_45_17b]|uniref:Uncharacterized protein n=1 Tax=Candidatus Ryanbacteria bacterium RIFCSPHIGHO2_01_FULL_45_22 TaxID=1802114 RepID=A0A1G2FXH9_9BACT|nr:MAG: hypothetical protein A2719_02090 [Candidatus Ryanbacteria bacterium RIFCSPHIGHO2_01_FULL_45_22]OGZ46430.1 MAG: hypothetical protein A3J55_03950 [Candidatus Ryanbacteria bacterium RIFCSPHIGHO2_02_FULL_45_17b]